MNPDPAATTGGATDAALREARGRLHERSQRFELALAAGRLGDWSWDAATDTVTLGDRGADIFGLPRQVPITWTAMRDLLHEDDRERARIAVERANETHTDYDIEYRVNKPSGGSAWIAARGRAIYTGDGAVVGMIGVVQDITDRKHSEQVLRDNEQRLRATFAQAAVGIAIASTEGRLLEMNQKFAAILGSSPEELRGRTLIELTHPDDVAQTREELRRLTDGEIQHYAIEKRYLRKDGAAVWCLATVTMIRDEEGRASQFVGVIEDITVRKRTEAALRKSEQFNRTIIESSRDCIKTLSLDGILLWISESSMRQLCIESAEQVVGAQWLDFWKGEDRIAAQRAVDAARNGAADSFVGRYAVQGVERWWDVVVSPIVDLNGRPERLLAVSRDVTERMVAERTLRDESRILALLNQTGSKVASQLDVQAILQAVTDSATELSGAQFGAFFYNTTDENGDAFQLYTLSGAPREAFDKFGHPRATPLFGPTFRGEGVIRSDDVMKDPRYGQWPPHHGKPAGHLPVRSYLAVPVISRSGDVLGGLFFGHSEPGIFSERSERLVGGVAAQAAVAIDNARLYESAQKSAERERAARAAVERLNATKDEFLATLSHELRTPLSAIVGWSQTLRRETDPVEIARAIEIIERNARAQTQLIDDLLDMSRITSGKVRLDIQPVLPYSFVEAAADSLRPAAEAKGVRLEVLLDPVAGPVSGDPGRLQQVVWNLVSNAVKFTPRGGKVQVRLERVNSHVEITVSDTGCGIPPEFLDHVFERFRQADSSTTRRHGGLGLGLSIVRHLVELHGGSVHASSPGVDRGATFRVNLPLKAVHPIGQGQERLHPKAPTSTAAPEYPPVDLAGIRVLVVDDEPDARDLVAHVLSRCRAEIFTCASAAEALQKLPQVKPTVLISDIGMPEMDGYELLRRVRALGPVDGLRIPAIALTAFARSEDRTRALRAGFVVHVAKPVDPAELVATVASLSGRVAE